MITKKKGPETVQYANGIYEISVTPKCVFIIIPNQKKHQIQYLKLNKTQIDQYVVITYKTDAGLEMGIAETTIPNNIDFLAQTYLPSRIV